MDSSPLLTPYRDDERFSALLGALQLRERHCFQIEGLAGSLPYVLVAAAYEALKGRGQHLLVLPDEEALNGCKRSLEALVPEAEWKVWLPGKADEPRIAALHRSSAQATLFDPVDGTHKAWVLVLPSTLQEIVQKTGHAHQIGRRLRLDDEIEPEVLSREMSDQGFQETEEVLEPGTYALRAGRMDIFSYAHTQPIRLTLWGNKLKRITYFDTETQLSVEEVPTARLLMHPDHPQPYAQKVPLFELLTETYCCGG